MVVYCMEVAHFVLFCVDNVHFKWILFLVLALYHQRKLCSTDTNMEPRMTEFLILLS